MGLDTAETVLRAAIALVQEALDSPIITYDIDSFACAHGLFVYQRILGVCERVHSHTQPKQVFHKIIHPSSKRKRNVRSLLERPKRCSRNIVYHLVRVSLVRDGSRYTIIHARIILCQWLACLDSMADEW